MSDLDVLRRKRGHAKAAITRVEKGIACILDTTAVEELYVQLELLEKGYLQFKEYDEDIVDIDDSLSEIEAIEQRYLKAKATLRKAIHGRSPMVTAVQTQLDDTMRSFTTHQREMLDTMREQSFSAIPKDEIKLPKIQIPFFTGKYSEFPSFKDLFSSSIHNNSILTNVHKFQYLKGLLRDDAANLLRHIAVTDANYLEAWEKLCRRYDNQGLVITSLIKQFMSQPVVTTDCTKLLRKICDTSDEVIRGLKALGEGAETRDPWLIHIILQKLDEETRKQWAIKSIDTEYPTFKTLLSFIAKRCAALETCEPVQQKRPSPKPLPKTYQAQVTDIRSPKNGTPQQCIKCESSHKLHECSQYNKLSLEEKREFVAMSKICFNCLFKGHLSSNCPSRRRCFICQRKHHTSLHPPQESKVNVTVEEKEVAESLGEGHTLTPTTHAAIMERYSLLPTALVNIRDVFGKNHCCRVLLDTGSETSLITQSCINKLQLPRHNCRIPITGIASNATTKGRTAITITSRIDAEFVIEVDVFILDKLTSKLPRLNSGTVNNWKELTSLQVADPLDQQCREIDVLLGANQFFKILRHGQITGPNGLIAQNTALGWIISGGETKSQKNVTLQIEFDIDQTLRKFWELEELPSKPVLTPDQKYCEELFINTHTRDSSGRFVVRLPFANESRRLGSSLQQATSRFMSLEAKLQRQPVLKNAYTSFMEEYQKLNHMTEFSPKNNDFIAEHFYLPHHPVIKPDSTTTKVRVVFDGSAASTSSISLNSKLLVGPTVQSELISILLRFRLHPVAFTADVERMYRQVRVDPRDCEYQRIVWRNRPNEPLKHYRLQTVTYGTSAAPFLATRALHQLGIESKTEHPEASNAILQDFYVDDLLSGGVDVPSTLILATNIANILNTAGFPLHKFSSNSPELLSSVAKTHISRSTSVVSIDESSEHKILGLRWDTKADMFKFKVNEPPKSNAFTKRTFLSESSRLYDPLGWLSPVIVSIKSLFQQLWLLHIGWDDPLPPSTVRACSTIRNDFKQLERIRIPRFIQITSPTKSELHGFADASSTAYAAVLYCRTADEIGNVHIRIVAAKTRVAPIKTISIPRLELCGALLLATLTKAVIDAMKLHSIPVYSWTDSEVVLHWLSQHPSKWKVFIANRTTKILETMPTTTWNHIASSDNPADVASRGCTSSDLVNHSLWWKGPSWLKQPKDTWPMGKFNDAAITDKGVLEARTVSVHKVTVDEDLVSRIASRNSKYTTLVRVVVHLRRFITLCRPKHSRTGKPTARGNIIKAEEYRWAEKQVAKIVQQQQFVSEIKLLKTSKQVTKGNLASLSPFLDDEGLLRVGGRLKNADCSYNQRHPIILPNHHILSKMILSYLHLSYLHPGPSLLSHLSRQSYWIITVRKLARKVTNDCIICRRLNARPINPIMGNLPVERVTPTKPFTHTGIDMAGPIEIATKTGRGAKFVKSYIVVFVCMATKAIHLELAGNLTTDAFLAALKRFVSRRGLPATISCDNGTNFVGARRKLSEAHQQLYASTSDASIHKFTTEHGIEWKFNPPASPHFGGLWEAAVRSVKHHVTRMNRQSKLTFEEFSTLLCQIEAVLNSRPLTPATEDCDTIFAITPAHFLTTAPLLSVPVIDNTDTPDNRLTRWEELQKRVHKFWKRYTVEYINNLQQRNKWKIKNKNLQIGDIVLVKNMNLPPLQWPLARITKVHTGEDGIVRVVTLKTATSTMERPVVKLVKLIEVKEQVP